ncbi:UDP-N-acetylglucosamine 2-epimerase [Aquisphaera giovannonii]|uniref:UDP-N-acetylglucosamine 2-epimerase (non-hydrolyzing) n=1 Tax=Aquisphaera giovannonii TaxID=406548 RepID=A0A5B9W3I3_9BACT|nr:UDP-N-acetylglucosamine 2-epimerase (non-hydrolyzing) [Aquisphaera giovannonii]QEH35148.1 UDP-N-acetylglucosamine 2-epimerase [Aquisphaera giovannonii]
MERPAVMTVFGTRPELIKLAPVVRALEGLSPSLRAVTVSTGQHRELLAPFLDTFRVRVDHALHVMTPGQTPNQVCSRILAALDPVLDAERPAMVLVQGDTTSALAGALAAFHRGVRVGHVEAGLRSGDRANPFPEEMNRRLISRLADFHFAATERNRASLLAEGVPPEAIVVTGNPIVDALGAILGAGAGSPSPSLKPILDATRGLKRIVLTTHRRESFGGALAANLRVLRDFLARREEFGLIFPVHPNPEVRRQAAEILAGRPRVHLVEPLDYPAFLGLLAAATLIVSDSGGVQEEAPSLGKPVIVLRTNTERPESVAAGFARLAGGDPAELARLLDEACTPGSWATTLRAGANPYGAGDAGPRIARAVAEILGVPVSELAQDGGE